jgi:hypothetical protein
MPDQSQSLSWADLLSWDGVGWDVALLIGVWGALMGIGHYFLADLFFILAILLFCLKWGHFTNILTPRRRIRQFSLGILIALALIVTTVMWTSKQAREAQEEKQKLSRLDLIPGLQQQINDLRNQNTVSSADISEKQTIVGDTDGSGAAYQIFERGGEWYYSPSSGGKGEPDVRVDLLQPIKFACPAAG